MEHFKLIYQWIFTLLITTWLVTLSRGTSVSLVIVEGGDSLVGSFCPGTVRLFCEGTELTSLRWRYNGNINIVSYFPDSMSAPQPTESAFFMTQLIAIARNPNNLILANYSSNLTVDLTQLESNAVTEISCSDPGVSQVEPVNVNIIKPNNPNITMVTIAYRSGELDSLEVTWEKSDNPCFTSGLFYEVNLTASDSVLVNHFSANCGEVLCVVSFNNLLERTELFTVSIRAENELGASELVFYPTIIAQQVQQYFIPQVFSKDGQLVGECTLAQGFVGNAICTIQHTTDSMYRNLSNEITVPLDTEFPLLVTPVSNTTYYLQFTVLINNTLLLTDQLVFRFSRADTGVPGWGIALIVIAVTVLIVVVSVVVVSVVIVFIIIPKKRSIKNKAPVTNESGMSMNLVGEDQQECGKSSESQGVSTNSSEQTDEAKQSTERDRSNPSDKITEMFDLPSQEGIGGHITLSVMDNEKRYEGFWRKSYTVYEIIVRRDNKVAFVWRRYNEFKELAQAIQEKYGLKPSQLNFPEEIRVTRRNFNKDFITSRQEALDKFLKKVIKIHAVDMSLIRDFLVTDNFKAEKELEQRHV